jgi:hypothetical protein
MFSTRQTGPVYTSVRLAPGCLLVCGAFFLIVAAAGTTVWDRNLLAIPWSIGLLLLGGRLIYIAVRQIIRGLRIFLS